MPLKYDVRTNLRFVGEYVFVTDTGTNRDGFYSENFVFEVSWVIFFLTLNPYPVSHFIRKLIAHYCHLYLGDIVPIPGSFTVR